MSTAVVKSRLFRVFEITCSYVIIIHVIKASFIRLLFTENICKHKYSNHDVSDNIERMNIKLLMISQTLDYNIGLTAKNVEYTHLFQSVETRRKKM